MDLTLLWRQIKWRIGIKSPIVANLKITNRCNLRCKMCSEEIRTGEQQEIDSKKWKEIIKTLYDRGVRVVVFEGGEPTTRKDIEKIIEYTRSLGIYSIMITNGVNEFHRFNPDVIWISIDGIEKYHNEVRGEGVYGRIKENLKKAAGKNIAILSMINGKNKESIEEFVNEHKEYLIYFNWIYGYKNSEMEELSSEEKEKTKNKIVELKSKGYKIFNSYKTLNKVGNGRKKCSYWLLATVDSGGNIYDGCMVRRFDSVCRCDMCDLACYLELNNIYNLDYETRNSWKEMVGIDLTFKFEKFLV